MARFKKTTFEELQEGWSIKHPARGKDSRIGTVRAIIRQQDKVNILVEWAEGGISSATRNKQFEILAKEK